MNIDPESAAAVSQHAVLIRSFVFAAAVPNTIRFPFASFDVTRTPPVNDVPAA